MNIESESDFGILIDIEIRKSRVKYVSLQAELLEELAKKCFHLGFKAGQLPVNRPIDLKRIAKGNSNA